MMLKNSGAYHIFNLITGDRYIGGSLNIKRRWGSHLSELGGKRDHTNIHLQRAWDVYGEASFKFSVLEYCCPIKEIVEEREQAWLDYFDFDDLYNICPTAGSNLGFRHSKETKSKGSKLVTYNGKTQLISEWAEEYNIKYITLSARLNQYGWSIKRALTTPVRRYTC